MRQQRPRALKTVVKFVRLRCCGIQELYRGKCGCSYDKKCITVSRNATDKNERTSNQKTKAKHSANFKATFLYKIWPAKYHILNVYGARQRALRALFADLFKRSECKSAVWNVVRITYFCCKGICQAGTLF